MPHLSTIACISVAVCLACHARGQGWIFAAQTQGAGVETADRCAPLPQGGAAYAGVFDQAFSLYGSTLAPEAGGRDVYIACAPSSTGPGWAMSGGSLLDDELSGLCADAEGNIFAAGAFWFSAHFGDALLEAGSNPKGLFLLKIAPQGSLLWGRALQGTGIKGLSSLQCDAFGHVWVAGFFGGQLTLGDTTLQAVGDTDLFLAKFSTDGQLLWALREGWQRDTRATALVLTAQGEPRVGGYFNGQTRLANQTFNANTFDRDAFIAAYRADGTPRWAVKAGGVHDDDLSSLAIDEQGNLYATGFLVGVMSLGNGISIQSATGNPDFFILQYAPDGTPLRARALGGLQSQLATGIAAGRGYVAVCGYFQGVMQWDGLQLQAGSAFAGFVAYFNTQLEGIGAQAAIATGGVFLQQIHLDADGRLWVAGSFGGQGDFPAGSATALGAFDGFLLCTTAPVRTRELEPTTIGWRISPNPANDWIEIQGAPHGQIFWIADATGRRCAGPVPTQRLYVGHLSPGVYYLCTQGKALPFLKTNH